MYNIKVIEDKVRYQEEFRNIFSSKVFVIMVQAEFCPVNCPLSPPIRFYKSKQQYKFFKPSNFCFPNLYVCDYFLKHFNHYSQNFQELRPPKALQMNGSLVSLSEKQWTIFKSLFHTLPCFKVNLGIYRLLYVSRWNRSTVLLNLWSLRMLVITM